MDEVQEYRSYREERKPRQRHIRVIKSIRLPFLVKAWNPQNSGFDYENYPDRQFASRAEADSVFEKLSKDDWKNVTLSENGKVIRSN